MDPQTAWDSIVTQLRSPLFPSDDEREALADTLRALATWIEQGGFLPRP